MSETKTTPIATGEKLYLLSALVKEEKALDELTEFVKKHEVTVKKSENLGERALTFAVNKQKSALLVSVFFTAEPSAIPALDKDLRHEEYVMRFLLTDWKGDLDAPKRRDDRRKPKTEGAEVK